MGPAASGTAMGLGRRTRKENVVTKRSLVVVESPTKVKTIQKYLNSSFIVKASMGHVRDLPKSQLGVDPKKGFKPKYVVSPSKKKVLDELRSEERREGKSVDLGGRRIIKEKNTEREYKEGESHERTLRQTTRCEKRYA